MSLQTSISPEFFPLAVPFVAAPELDGQVLTITISGELDIGTVHLLEEAQHSVEGKYQSLRYELAGLGFLDSSGIRALLAPRNSQVPMSKISISHPTRPVRRLLELRDLHEMIVGCTPSG